MRWPAWPPDHPQGQSQVSDAAGQRTLDVEERVHLTLGHATETEPEPQVLADRLRAAVPRTSSAVGMIGSPSDIDDMLAAFAECGGEELRSKLTADQGAVLQAALREAPSRM